MDGVEACPWGLLSLAGSLAVLVVAPSQCVEACYDRHGNGSGGAGQRRAGGSLLLLLLLLVVNWLEVRGQNWTTETKRLNRFDRPIDRSINRPDASSTQPWIDQF